MTTAMVSTTSVCRGLAACAGRRCRAPAPVALPMVQRVLDASGNNRITAVTPSSVRGYSRSAATMPTGTPVGAGVGVPTVRTRPCNSYSPNVISAIGKTKRSQRQPSLMFSTTNAVADTDTGDSSGGGGGDAGAPAVKTEGEGAGSKQVEGVGDGDGEAAPPALEANPLDGLAEDDGDPGPPPPLDPSIVTEPSEKVLEVMAGIDSLNFIETAMLIDLFKNKLGLDEVPTLSYGGGDGGAGGDGGDGGDAPAAADKTVFKVKLTGFGDKAKIKVIKEVRAVTGLGLREAKEMVESLPQVVKEDVKDDEAQELKTKLEAAGATVELE